MNSRKIILLAVVLLFAFSSTTIAENAESRKTILFQKESKPLAQYRFGDVAFKPYVDELRTPSGKNVLRDSSASHPHHRALMYGIRVNGYSFWHEWDTGCGKQITGQCRFEDGVVITEIHWNTPDSKTLLKEIRNITVTQGENVTFLDWQSTLTAAVDTVLDGNSYYGLGMRFNQEMDRGGRFFDNTGVHDGERVNGDERLKRCRWMAYTATLNGEPVTVAVFDHPANPIPMTAFTMGDAGGPFAYMSATMNLHRQSVELKTGETFKFQYRIAVWDGETPLETIEKMSLDQR
jgi:hypothetical protein